jgi:hemolysin III
LFVKVVGAQQDRRAIWMAFCPFRFNELANTISHGIGLIAALIGTPILLLAASETGSGGFLVGTIVFITAMLALYLTPTLYHAWPETRTKCALRVFHTPRFLS